MRLLHTADLHVGANRSFPHYLERYQVMLDEILEVALDREVNVVVLSGDILDTARPNQEEKELISSFLGKCPVPVALTYGNHEYRGPRYNNTSLEWLISLASKTPTIKMWRQPSVEKWQNAWWVVIPYGRWSTPDFSFIAKSLLHRIPKDNTLPIIGIAHEFFEGAVTDTGYTPKEGTKTRLPRLNRIDYWALGDIHVFQRVWRNAWYSGSPMQLKFGDKLPKGVVIVDIGSEPELVPIKKPKRLLDIKGIPNVWPEDALIKLHCDARDLPPRLPDSVVRLEQLTITPVDAEEVKEVHRIVGSNYLVDGLEPFFQRKLRSRLQIRRAKKYAQRLIKQELENL